MCVYIYIYVCVCLCVCVSNCKIIQPYTTFSLLEIFVVFLPVKGATVNCVTYEGVAEFIYWGTLISNTKTYFGRQ